MLLLGYVSTSDLEEAVSLGSIISIYDYKRAAILNKIAEDRQTKVQVHLKIDALFGRQGILPKDFSQFVNQLQRLKNIEIDGLYSHFSEAKDPENLTHTKKQIKEFERLVKTFEQSTSHQPKIHLTATSGTLLLKRLSLTNSIVRIGAGIYGHWPSEKLKASFEKQVILKPVMRWISHVAQVKTIPSGFPIGYGRTFVTRKSTKVAVVPQGYSDGYDRELSNRGEVLIKGTFCPVIGRVSMNMFTIDVSHLKNVNSEDEVVLLGHQGTKSISVDDLAKLLKTINYEVTSRISPLLPRLVA